MDLPLWLQYLVIGLVALVALWMFLRRQFPGLVRRARIAVAAPMVREGRPPWMRTLARRIAPAVRADGSACGGCNGCGDDGPPR